VFGPDLLKVLLVLIVGIAAIAVSLWAIIDAASRPSGTFRAADSSIGMWISLIAVFWLFTGIVG
jgi:hypothetical protein